MTQTSDYQRPIPVPDEASRPFFEGAKQHRLMLQKCEECGTYMWPVKPACDSCLSTDVTWVQASGKGTLYSFVLMHQIFHPGFASEIPYNIFKVDLEEGLRILSNFVGIPNDALTIGMPLEVTFEDVTGKIAIPKFTPIPPKP